MQAISSFDDNNDGKLSREEFAKMVITFAKSASVSPHELIDFMVVTSAVKDNSTVEKAYIKSVKTRTTEENNPNGQENKQQQTSLGGLWKNIRNN